MGPSQKTASCHDNEIIDTYELTFWFSHATDPLLHYGRHFGRTVHALCTVSSILTNGVLRITDDDDRADEEYPPEYDAFSWSENVDDLPPFLESEETGMFSASLPR